MSYVKPKWRTVVCRKCGSFISNNALGRSAHLSACKWQPAKYPGGTVRSVQLHREGELGVIRIFDRIGPEQYRVGSFLPGITEYSPGDTPKTWPEKKKILPRPEIREPSVRILPKGRDQRWVEHQAMTGCFIEFNWTANAYQFRIGKSFTDFRGVRSRETLADVRADLAVAGLCLGNKTDSRTWPVIPTSKITLAVPTAPTNVRITKKRRRRRL